jgi:glucosamine-6-phosphate deaminase
MEQQQMTEVRDFTVGTMKIEIHSTSEAAGKAAAEAARKALRELGRRMDLIGVIFATGASPFATLEHLTGMKDIPWGQVEGFHLDEYVGIAADHPASFAATCVRN